MRSREAIVMYFIGECTIIICNFFVEIAFKAVTSPAVAVAAMLLMSLAHMLQAIKLDGVLKDNTIYFIRTQEVIVIIRLHNLL